MKRVIIIFLALSLWSCDEDSQQNDISLNVSRLVGSWQIVSESFSAGGPQITSEIENGGTYTFGIDGTFNYSDPADNSLNYSGTFNLEEDILRLDYLRDGEDMYWELKITTEQGLLTWFPIGPSICIEGCSRTLRKTS